MAAWWSICLLVYLPMLVLLVVRIVYARGVRRLDLQNPDDLPHTAGEWLLREIGRLGLGDRLTAIVTDKESKMTRDAFHPIARTIQLDEDTYFKRDPVQWAIAAHELGHARFTLGWPILGRVIIACAWLRRALFAIGVGVAAGNVLYALPSATAFAFACLVAAAGLQLVELVEEGIASTLAMRSLRASPHLAPHHLAASRTALRLAYSTYLFAALSRAFLLTQWHLVERVTSVPRVPPVAHLTGLGWTVAIALSIVLLGYALSRIIVAIRPRETAPTRSFALVAATWKVALLGFLWLAWDHRADPAYATCALAACVMLAGFVELAYSLPAVVIHLTTVERLLRRFRVDPTVETSAFVDDRRAGRSHVRAGNSKLDALYRVMSHAPPIEYRFAQLAELAFLPLLVAFWR